jgi:surface antigen
MRPSRVIVAAAIVAAAPVVAVLGLTGGSSSVAAPVASLTAPVAQAPKVVAHAVVGPEQAVAAKPKPTTTHHVTRTAPAHVATTRSTHRTATRTTTTKPTSTKPTSTRKATSAAPAVRTGNDYPYASATGNPTDKWGFTERQCVSFAAWRLARNGRPLDNATQNWGSALHWDEAARAHGVRISSTPHVGAIAQWNAGEGGKVWVGSGTGRFTAGSYGHVGYVAAVYSDGSALIEQYNAQGDRQYSVMRMTAPRYLF